MKKILILVNDVTTVLQFRCELVRALVSEGHEVTVSVPKSDRISEIEALGAKVVETEVARHGKNPLQDLKLLRSYKRLLKELKPDIVLTFTIKPNVYGGMACGNLKIPYVANVTGLGVVGDGGIMQKLMLWLYKNGLKNVYCEGHVQDCKIDLFTDNEVVDLAIICENPYWKDLQEISADISNVLKQFTFPFAIDSNGVPFSTLRDSNTTNILNVGAETGIRITVRSNGEVKNLVIFDAKEATEQTGAFRLNMTLQAGETVVIDTEASPKTCKLYKPDGTVENVLKYVGANPTWFTLKKGINAFGFFADNGTTNAEITIGYTNKFLGV